tara:strand:+ start:515 stop:868 length:354 start_codon:yes stop_codon:yes gene_type:complete
LGELLFSWKLPFSWRTCLPVGEIGLFFEEIYRGKLISVGEMAFHLGKLPFIQLGKLPFIQLGKLPSFSCGNCLSVGGIAFQLEKSVSVGRNWLWLELSWENFLLFANSKFSKFSDCA